MFVNVGGSWINTVSFGAGPRTLVATGTWVIGWEAWQEPFESLSQSRRCIGYDGPEHAARWFECLYGVDLSSRLEDVAAPVLLIHGAADAIVPLKSSQGMARLLPRSELVVLPNGDHVPIVSAPQAVAAAIEAFGPFEDHESGSTWHSGQ